MELPAGTLFQRKVVWKITQDGFQKAIFQIYGAFMSADGG